MRRFTLWMGIFKYVYTRFKILSKLQSLSATQLRSSNEMFLVRGKRVIFCV